ncbi:oxidoreductase [Pseudomonas sp. A6]|uniref:oxidoreductase n=1 Tax=Pseudomonas sp. A6 TaxID=410021 RepID=UPI0040257E7A
MNTSQHPIPSGFSAATTADEVIRGIDLTGRTAIVTGGYSGLGRETARVFKQAGARVIVPARDVDRARAALAGTVEVEVWPMDLLDPASVGAFADRFLAESPKLDLLVNSAGIMAVPLQRDARGVESHFATNHLGHFQLTTRLLPALRAAGGARVVNLSSFGHRYSPVVFDDINFEHREYNSWLGYGQSKTANVLFTVALDAREAKNGIRAFAVHPGAIVGTGLEKHILQQALIDAGVLDAEGKPIIDPSRNLKTVAQGAATSVWCAVSPQLDGMGGVYCENVDVASLSTFEGGAMDMADSTRQGGVMPYAIDAEAADRLWRVSEVLLQK